MSTQLKHLADAGKLVREAHSYKLSEALKKVKKPAVKKTAAKKVCRKEGGGV